MGPRQLSLSLPYCTEQSLGSRDFHVMKPSIDKTSNKEEEDQGGACLGPGIIIRLQARQSTRTKVNTRVRGHGSTDRHDEWPKVPTRQHAYKLGSRREEDDVWSAPSSPLQYRESHSHTALTPPCLIITYHNNGTVTPYECACGCVNVYIRLLLACLSVRSHKILQLFLPVYVNLISKPYELTS